MNATEIQVKISRLATSLARTLYKKITEEEYTGANQASAHLVSLFHFIYVLNEDLINSFFTLLI